MSDPLAFLPLALAGANGTLNEVPVRRLVASGVALLQRCAPLVRALHGRRAAILLPPSPSLMVALAASDGRAALLLDAQGADEAIAQALASSDAGAVFTVASLAARLPAAMPRVLLDEAPERATWQREGEERPVDLTLHGGLRLEGEADVPGANEEVLVADVGDPWREAFGTPLTHRRLLAVVRAIAAHEQLAARDHTLALVSFSRLFGVVVGALAPLIAGGRVTAHRDLAPDEALALLEAGGVSRLVAEPATFASMLETLARRGRPLDAPVLQHCLAGGGALDAALAKQWYHETGVLLHRADVVGEEGSLAWDIRESGSRTDHDPAR